MSIAAIFLLSGIMGAVASINLAFNQKCTAATAGACGLLGKSPRKLNVPLVYIVSGIPSQYLRISQYQCSKQSAWFEAPPTCTLQVQSGWSRWSIINIIKVNG